MPSRLGAIISESAKPSHPSVVLILQANDLTNHVLHIVPEDGTIERFSCSNPSGRPFRMGGTKEKSREQLGTVLLHEDSEDLSQFLGGLKKQARQLYKEHVRSEQGKSSVYDDTHKVIQMLRTIALEGIQKWGTSQRQADGAQSYLVFLVQVDRPQPGAIANGTPKSVDHLF